MAAAFVTYGCSACHLRLQPLPPTVAGDVSLFDSRCLHAGGANESPRRRVLFYCSFIRAEHVRSASTRGTLLESLRGTHALEDWREWLA